MALKWNKPHPTYVMGILNVTPDSFSDGGDYHRHDLAVQRAQQLYADGADLIDVGGVSTRPGYSPVSVTAELARVIPVIDQIMSTKPLPLSVDTYRAEVAYQAILKGATIINDQWRATYDNEMASVAAEQHVPIVLMHNREDARYTHFFDEYLEDMQESIAICLKAGVARDKIILDPGFGFVKTAQQNLEVTRRLPELVALGYDVLYAPSRKRTIGAMLGDLPVTERMEGTGAMVNYAMMQGAAAVRVHDVRAIARMIRVMDIMTRKVEWDG
ncbi:dihydropteroate synthase [Brochothrix campestris]|uniref:Dihydropteroate synthase n=1 Tax=Brochothrix campestris FSL F6-1037 TaxID=1265861 RepID=W7CHZ8_9LIST|nr:dihydropteroate synthase [Brochothrix campestris]EUJ36597.1 dihydropteroate synthase [Brochothrix campestris FSL F6-1037]